LHKDGSPPEGALAAPQILVVDDNLDDARLMRIAFEKAQLRADLQFVASGGELLEYLKAEGPYSQRAQNILPDLLLLDLKMPGLGGFEVLEWLREHPPYNRLPVVVFSGSDQPVDINRALALGARRYLVKPQKMPELIQMVQGLYKFCRKLQAEHTLEHHGHPAA
jgi:CheY-like chemotaxis protein